LWPDSEGVHVVLHVIQEETAMNLKTVAALAASLIASSTFAAGSPAEQKCGAGSCGKKELSASADKKVGKDASCSKKEASCSKKDTPVK